MTEATIKAMQGMRDFSMLKWYAIPMLSIVFYIYITEIKKARENGNWDAILSGATLFGMDFINETLNGWIMNISGRSALWTAPGDSALKVMVGWNLEIIFMFAISGIIYYHTLTRDGAKVLGIPEKWFWAISYSAFCVFVEIFLNKAGLLIWEYGFWNRSFQGVWLIFLFGYFHFYVAIILVLALKDLRSKIMAASSLYVIAIMLNLIGFLVLGWNY